MKEKLIRQDLRILRVVRESMSDNKREITRYGDMYGCGEVTWEIYNHVRGTLTRQNEELKILEEIIQKMKASK